MELELLSNSTTGSEMSSSFSVGKSEPAVPLNLLRLGEQRGGRACRGGSGSSSSSLYSFGREEKKGGHGHGPAHGNGNGNGNGSGNRRKKSRGGKSDGKGCGGGKERKKKGSEEQQQQLQQHPRDGGSSFSSSCSHKAIQQYLLDCGGRTPLRTSADRSSVCKPITIRPGFRAGGRVKE